MAWWSFKPYQSVGQRAARARQTIKTRIKRGEKLSPVTLSSSKITTTFWGSAWCDNIESYQDYSNRLGRGRSYVRNGMVVDLQIKPGQVTALVSGSALYEIEIQLTPLKKDLWQAVKSQCAGQIGSLVDLLQGKLSKDVMNVVTAPKTGFFPAPNEIKMQCSCPDHAGLCKHLAAVMYGIGARFDEQPELLFQLRQVDHLELLTAAGEQVAAKSKSPGANTLADDALADIFGIELVDEPKSQPVRKRISLAKPKSATRKKIKKDSLKPSQESTSTPRVAKGAKLKKQAIPMNSTSKAPAKRSVKKAAKKRSSRPAK